MTLTRSRFLFRVFLLNIDSVYDIISNRSLGLYPTDEEMLSSKPVFDDRLFGSDVQLLQILRDHLCKVPNIHPVYHVFSFFCAL